MSKKTALLFALALGLVASGIFSLHSGQVDIRWADIFTLLLGRDTAPDDQAFYILSNLRVPRTLAAMAVGAALGASGLVLQTLLRNPLAEPYTLGLSGGSALGAVIALGLSLEPGYLWVPALSSLGCLAASGIVIWLGRRNLQFESRSLILFGVMISLFLGAAVVSGMSILSPEKLQSALYWLMGEFGTSRDSWIIYLGPLMLAGIIILFCNTWALDALSLGEARALSLGFAPGRKRIILILVCTGLTSLAVSISGLVGFIGLVSPHLARKILRSSLHRELLIASVLLGASLLVLADSLGRSLAGTTEIPAGSVAALLGAPALIMLLMRYRHAPAD